MRHYAVMGLRHFREKRSEARPKSQETYILLLSHAGYLITTTTTTTTTKLKKKKLPVFNQRTKCSENCTCEIVLSYYIRFGEKEISVTCK